jgi:secondary thiamine-phosphate synthase enzyme
MRIAQTELTIETAPREIREVTSELADWVARQGIGRGLLTVFIPHTSASLLIQENADPDVRRDFEAFFSRLAPDGDPLFIHTTEGVDDMPAHVRTALTAVNLSVPVSSGRMVLGTWQGIYVWEHRRSSHSRIVVAHLVGE